MPEGTILIDGDHCSRCHQNSGRLTPAVFARAVALGATLKNKRQS